jgi:VanZ family protein
MALIFTLSSAPVVDAVAGVPDWMTHGAGYAVLATLVARALAGGIRRPVAARVALLAVLMSFAYGITDELHQSFVPGRHADPWDLVKNLAGAIAGAAACAWPRGLGEPRRKAA